MMFGGLIYEGVKRAITDAVPSAIRDAVGWHTEIYTKEEVVERKVFTGKFIVMPREVKAKEWNPGDMPELAPEPKLEKEYKTIRQLVRKTYRDESRFNPITGRNEYKEDKDPMIEVFNL